MGKPAPLGVGADMTPPYGDLATNVLQGVFSAIGPSQPVPVYGQCNVALWGEINTTLTTTAGSLDATVASATDLAAGAAVNSVNVPDGATIGSISGTNIVLALPNVTLFGTLLANGQIRGLASTAGLLGATVTGPNIPSGATVTSIVQAAVLNPSYPGAPSVQGIVQLSEAPAQIAALSAPQQFTFSPTGSGVIGGADTNAIFTGAGVPWTGAVQLEYSFDGAATWLVANYSGGGVLVQWNNGVPTRTVFGEPERGVLYRLNCTAVTGTINYRFSTSGQAAMSLAIASPI
jgi:hypothetical protein